MIENRSVPVDTLLPHVAYSNVAEAIDWLHRTFGFIEHYRYGEPNGAVSGAQVRLGKAYLMLMAARPGRGTPKQLGHISQMLTVMVDDVASHYQRARSAGAKIVEDLNDTIYGERQYGAEDLDGHRWLFSQHVRDVDPADWGATVAEDLPSR